MEFDMPKTTCSIADCTAPALCRGWCARHYQRWYKTGGRTHEPARQATVAAQFWVKVFKTPTCWIWTAHVMPTGYGQFCYGTRATARKAYAHRFAYKLTNGPIPDGLHVDHLCRNRACVNPEHLEAVTQQENNRRANSIRWAAWRDSRPLEAAGD